MDNQEMMLALEKIGSFLNLPSRLVLIGSSVGMFHGQPSRMTEDIDVWRPASRFDDGDLRQACDRAGVLFNPTGDIPENTPYLQMIAPGIVRIGDYLKTGEINVSTFSNLEVAHPPIENIIASKLLRAEPRDIEDIIFLRRKFDISNDQIEAVIASIPPSRQEAARENIVYLDVADSTAMRQRMGKA